MFVILCGLRFVLRWGRWIGLNFDPRLYAMAFKYVDGGRKWMNKRRPTWFEEKSEKKAIKDQKGSGGVFNQVGGVDTMNQEEAIRWYWNNQAEVREKEKRLLYKKNEEWAAVKKVQEQERAIQLLMQKRMKPWLDKVQEQERALKEKRRLNLDSMVETLWEKLDIQWYTAIIDDFAFVPPEEFFDNIAQFGMSQEQIKTLWFLSCTEAWKQLRIKFALAGAEVTILPETIWLNGNEYRLVTKALEVKGDDSGPIRRKFREEPQDAGSNNEREEKECPGGSGVDGKVT
jgi:hypothetical protein